jgi:antitoxin component of MazEF toxin-antitoxin module
VFGLPAVFEVKIGKVGNSLKITLPRPACEGLGLKAGDMLILTVTDHIMEAKKKQP